MSNKEKQEFKRDTSLNLWQRISLIMSEVNYVQKSMTVGSGDNSYKGTSSKDLFIKVNEAMVRYGVVCPQLSFTFERFYYQGEKEYYGKISKTFQREIVGTYTGELINIDKPEERQQISAIGQGIDSQDKASGKAQTYALKQALLDTFIVATGTDTDNTHSDQLTKDFSGEPKEKETVKKHTPPPAKKEAPKSKEKPILTQNHRHFKACCDGLKIGKTTIEDLIKLYEIPNPMLILLQKIVTNKT